MRKAQRRTFALPTTGSIRAYYCRRLFNHRTSRLQTTQLAGVVYLECGLEMNPRNKCVSAKCKAKCTVVPYHPPDKSLSG